METRHFSARPPAVAGMFYERSKDRLARDVDQLISGEAETLEDVEIVGLIAPHAGYVYSGHVAGRAYRELRNHRYDSVVVLAPSHRDYFRGASVYAGNYITPLGIVESDMDVIERLVSTEGSLKATDLGHREEHAVEVQLPFLQRILPSFRLVPIVIGTQDWTTCQAVADRLIQAIGTRKVLVVASSDLSHYHSDAEARRLDDLVVKNVEAMDERKLYDDVIARRCEACGAGAIVSAILLAKALGASKASVVDYHTSAEINGEYDEVVGYLAGVLFHPRSQSV